MCIRDRFARPTAERGRGGAAGTRRTAGARSPVYVAVLYRLTRSVGRDSRLTSSKPVGSCAVRGAAPGGLAGVVARPREAPQCPAMPGAERD
eukprot:448752-Prymnesium_polylepis.1